MKQTNCRHAEVWLRFSVTKTRRANLMLNYYVKMFDLVVIHSCSIITTNNSVWMEVSANFYVKCVWEGGKNVISFHILNVFHFFTVLKLPAECDNINSSILVSITLLYHVTGLFRFHFILFLCLLYGHTFHVVRMDTDLSVGGWRHWYKEMCWLNRRW